MRFHYKKEFLKRFDEYSSDVQKLILETDQQIKNYFLTLNASYGLRIKKIGPKTFETRVNDNIRLVYVKDKDLISFVLLGNHDEIRRFIKQL